MVPYADFSYFGLLFYLLLPLVAVGIWGRLRPGWTLAVMAGMLVIQTSGTVNLRPGVAVRELYLLLGYAVYQGALAGAFLRWKGKWPAGFWTFLGLSLVPLMAAKVLPFLSAHTVFGFMGISYVTFRSLDVLFSIQDGLIKQISWVQYAAYLLFLPTLSSGPVDRFRRFSQDWQKMRTRSDFLDDLEVAVQRLARGFWYKFVFAALIKTFWMDSVSVGRGVGTLWAYMYAYTLYLFFDFAGYSAFAVGVGRILGIRVPENFDRPFLSKNIRDFWNRWHISLSFWFRDHVYMRFLLAASKAKWFKGKHTASYLGLFLTFGLMGVWHGLTVHYILYGLFHAALLSGYDWFARVNKERRWWGSAPWQNFTDTVLTLHAVAFGLLLFSGRLTPPPPPAQDFRVEKISGEEVVGWMWDRSAPKQPREVYLVIDEAIIESEKADLYREDLRDRGYGKGRCGFRFTMPWWVRDGRPHLVEIRDVLTGQPLPGYPQSLEFERNEEEIQREEAKMRREQEAEAAAREKTKKADKTEKAEQEKGKVVPPEAGGVRAEDGAPRARTGGSQPVP